MLSALLGFGLIWDPLFLSSCSFLPFLNRNIYPLYFGSIEPVLILQAHSWRRICVKMNVPRVSPISDSDGTLDFEFWSWRWKNEDFGAIGGRLMYFAYEKDMNFGGQQWKVLVWVCSPKFMCWKLSPQCSHVERWDC
jgi:hypothetical protein